MAQRCTPHPGARSVCLEFNPHRSRVLASGGSDGSVVIVNFEKPGAPEMYKPGGDAPLAASEAEVCCLGWNRQVQHILATATTRGEATVWDLKARKAAISIRDPAGRLRSATLAWVPSQATQMVIAYDDDRNPFLQMIRCIIDGDLDEMVRLSDVKNWMETLALLVTYSREEFPMLCEKLGRRLETERF
eukprot:Selendium_serpulae@DN10753_c0_g1_i1.p2